MRSLSRPSSTGSTSLEQATGEEAAAVALPSPKKVFIILNQLSGTYARAKKSSSKKCISGDEDVIVSFLEACFGEPGRFTMRMYIIDDPSKAKLDTPEFIALIAREAAENDIIIAGGGDGTVASILSAMANAITKFGVKRTPVAILPLGTGNIINQELGLPEDWKRSAVLISRSFETNAPLESRSIDALRIGDRHRFLNVDVGAGSKMISLLKDAEKQKWGKMAYFKNTLKILGNHQPIRYEVTIDDQSPFEMHASELVVANAGAVGLRRDQRWGPNISISDGRADIIAVRATGWASYVHVMWMLYSKKTAKLREKVMGFGKGPSSVRNSADDITPSEVNSAVVAEAVVEAASAVDGEISPPSSGSPRSHGRHAPTEPRNLRHLFKLPHFDFSCAYQRVTIDIIDKCCSEPMPVQADGDLIGVLPVTIEVAKHAVDVLVPHEVKEAGNGRHSFHKSPR